MPPPTFCPECRLARKLVFRNLRSLYHRKCDAPGHTEQLISTYAPDASVNVYDHEYWWSDDWDAGQYGKVYDFKQSFFEQMSALARAVPWPNLVITNSENSEYCNSVLGMKNCYLVFAAIQSENCAYGEQIDFTKDSYDIKRSRNNELCYELLGCNSCYKTAFGAFSDECSECTLVTDCAGCQHCFGCVGLRNKSYYIFNEPYAKDEYHKRVKELSRGSFRALEELKTKFSQEKLKYPYRYARIRQSTNATGDNLAHAKNCHYCFEAFGEGLEDSRYVVHTYNKPVRQAHSVFTTSTSEKCYEAISIRNCSNVFFSKKIWTGHDVQYSWNCHNSSYCFGCVGLRNKQYCILNRQYTKEEYEELLPKVIRHMEDMPYTDKLGRVYRYGEFFPLEFSPFGYNETVAQEYFPLDEGKAVAQGYRWAKADSKNHTSTKHPEELADRIGDVPDTILQDVIGCAHAGRCAHQCATAFKILPQELQFYRLMDLPLPRLCPNCRHALRIQIRNPLKLWDRICSCGGKNSKNMVYTNATAHFHGSEPCSNKFQTSYAPERPEIVYCEQCYQAEVA